MRIQYVSDLHLEGCTIDLVNNSADVLVLAGDITTAKSYKNHYDFFKNCSDNFKDIIYVTGNHEFYRGDIEETREELFEFLYRNFKNIHFLENDSVRIGDHRFFGCTFWTDCNGNDPITKSTIQQGMNDYRLIQWKSREHWKLHPDDTIELHRQSIDSLRKCLEDSDQPVIVVSHHAPTYMSVHPRFANSRHMNGGYASDLSNLIGVNGDRIPLWFHGHMHDSVDYQVYGKTKVLSNPRGYMIVGADGKRYTENELFDPGKVVEL